jgi:hypothetical protein
MREAYADQYAADVPSTDRQRSTQAAIVAVTRTFLPWSASTRHANQVGIALCNEGSQARGGCSGAAAFVVATR